MRAASMALLLSLATAPAIAQDPAALSRADPLAAIAFPVPELGGCADRDACAQYCDALSNRQACTAFARSRDLPAARVGAAVDFPVTELGGCLTPTDCLAYCEQPSALAACLDFAQRRGLIDDETADDARRVLPHLAAGNGPGGCTSEASCMAYCDIGANLEECLTFAQTVGILSDEEAAVARSIQTEGGPGGCRSRDACMTYCDTPANRYACFTYAKEKKLITDDEAAVGQRFFDLGAQGPAGCVSKADCMAACDDPANFEACASFAHDIGVIDDDQWQAVEVLRDAGPGEFPAACVESGRTTAGACMEFCSQAPFPCGGPSEDGVGAPQGTPLLALPQECRDRGLEGTACGEYCGTPGNACTGAGGLPTDIAIPTQLPAMPSGFPTGLPAGAFPFGGVAPGGPVGPP